MSAYPQEPQCAYCGEDLGAHEPVILLLPGEPARRTSRHAEGRVPGYAVVLHERCHGHPERVPERRTGLLP